MWVQLVKARIKAGTEDELQQLYAEASRRTGRDTGWVRSISLRSSKDPQQTYGLVIFESEAKAREYERSPEQAELTGKLGQLMDGPPEFLDFDEVVEYAP